MKQEIFKVEKDFGDKTLKNVFVKQQSEANRLQQDSVADVISQAKKFICVAAENAFSDELIKLLYNARKEKGIRIYVLVKTMNMAGFEQLKNNCIIRTVPDISGNYLICDRTVAFFFDEHLRGYALKNPETVGKLHDVFIYEFWNNAESEFIAKENKVSEQTFDVSPVQGNERVIINRSALSEKPYDTLLLKATDFVITNQNISEIMKSADTLYLDKKGCEKNREYLLQNSKKCDYFSDDCCVPLCKSGGKWYISNSSFENTSNNDGKLFFVEMENEPIFSNAYRLENVYTYRDAVEKEMLALKDFSPVTISASDEEQRSFDCDYKEFKRIKKMNNDDRENEFTKRNLLKSNKLSATIKFTINMTVSKLSKGAERASIYKDYHNFTEEMNKDIAAKNKLIKECAGYITKFEVDLKRLNSDISEKTKQIEECENKQRQLQLIPAKMQELTGKINEGEKSKSDVSQYEKQLIEEKKESASLKKDCDNVKKYKNEKNALDEKLRKTESALNSEQQKKTSTEDCLSKIAALEKEPKTVKACKEISDILNLGKFIPAFDEPRFGTLYEVKNGYEYALNSDEDSENAEKEMQVAGLQNVKFVASEK